VEDNVKTVLGTNVHSTKTSLQNRYDPQPIKGKENKVLIF